MTHAIAAIALVAWWNLVTIVSLLTKQTRLIPKAVAVTFALIAGTVLASPWLTDTGLWTRRWDCGEWENGLGEAYILADLLVFAAYVAFPFVGAMIAYKHRELLPPTPLIATILLFIFWCGTGHAVDALMFVWPAYALVVFTRIMTAIVSWVAVCMLYEARDFLTQYKAPENARRLNEQLLAEIKAREVAVAEREIEHKARMLVEEERELYRRSLESQNKQLGRTSAKLREIVHQQQDELEELRTRAHESGQLIAPDDLDHYVEQQQALRKELHDFQDSWRIVPYASSNFAGATED